MTFPPKTSPVLKLIQVKYKNDIRKMPKRNYTPEQIINSLREAEVLLSKGSAAGEAARHLNISEQTYCKWRKGYGGMRIN